MIKLLPDHNKPCQRSDETLEFSLFHAPLVNNMEDETSGKGFTLILGGPYFMTARIKIDVHAGTLSMEFNDNLVYFNIFEAMKHPTEDPLLFGIDIIDELVAEYMQLDTDNAEFSNFSKDIDVISCLGSVANESNYHELLEVQDLSDSKDDTANLANLDHNFEFIDLIDQVCKYDEESKCSKPARVQVVETEKLLPAQVATILTTESDSANQGRDLTRAESNSCNETNVESDSASRGQKLRWDETDSSEETHAKSNLSIQLRVSIISHKCGGDTSRHCESGMFGRGAML
ncbi:hypothetical protein CR513_33483, partial [Mucuna pruriens]